ncbi:MAG: serine kinase [Rhodobacteraceae bacterium]|nr:serine kinase [Paracoccaceae bacterium]
MHATSVALGNSGLLIRGASGSGKSGLALQLMAFGARLISDDGTVITVHEGGLMMTAPEKISGLIEARGIGLLQADVQPSAWLRLVVDLDEVEAERLPPHRTCDLLGQKVALLHKVESPHFPAAVLQYLKGGRHA